MNIDAETRQLLDSLEGKDLDKERSFLEDSLKARFVEDVCRVLKETGISQAELARRLGKSRQYVSRVLNENANFTLGSLVDIALALDCTIELRIHRQETKSMPEAQDEENPPCLPHIAKGTG